MKLEFPGQIFENKNTQTSNFMKIRLVVPSGRAGGRTDTDKTGMAKLIAAFRNFANAPKFYIPPTHTVFVCFVWI